MKINLTATVLRLDGKPFEEKKGEAVTLADVCLRALEATYMDEPSITGAEKYARFELMCRINGADELDLTAEEISKLKTLIGKSFAVPVVGPAYDLLEGRKRVSQAAPSKAKYEPKHTDATIATEAKDEEVA